jgi:hypothetical protein
MGRAHRIHAQRGFGVVLGIIIVVVVALMVATLARMTAADSATATLEERSAQAYFIARSGVEGAGQALAAGGACDATLAATQAIGSGSYTTGATLNATATSLAGSGITSATQSVIPVASTAGLATHGMVSVLGEAIQYGSTGASAAVCSGASACLLAARRGQAGTTALAAASVGTAVSQRQCTVRSTGTVAGTPGAVRVVEGGFQLSGYQVGGALNNVPQAMVVYVNNVAGSRLFASRTWSAATGGWSAPASANSVSATIQHLSLALAPDVADAVVGVKDANGKLYVQTWNGAAWTIRGGSPLAQPGSASPLGAIDAVYPANSHKALIVYGAATLGAPLFATWDGTTFTSGGNTTIGAGSGTTAPTYQVDSPMWIELAANPSGGDVSLAVAQTHSSATTRRAVRAAWWNGTAFTQINGGNSFGVTSSTGVADRPASVAYEAVSGRALYAWATGGASTLNYAVYTGAAQNVAPTAVIIASAGTCRWVRLTGAPKGNNIMLAVQTSTQALSTRLWSGGAWTLSQQHSTATQTATEKNFDFAFEGHPDAPGWGWITWAEGGSVRRQRLEGAAWNTAVVNTAAAGAMNYIALQSNPVSGRLFDAAYPMASGGTVTTATRVGYVRNLTASANPVGWTAPPVVGGTAGQLGATTVANTGERVVMAVRPAGAALIDVVEIFP